MKKQNIYKQHQVKRSHGYLDVHIEGINYSNHILDIDKLVLVIANCAYEAKERNQLSLQKGEIIRILKRTNDGNWFEGFTLRRYGWFPSRLVHEIQDPMNQNCNELKNWLIDQTQLEKLRSDTFIENNQKLKQEDISQFTLRTNSSDNTQTSSTSSSSIPLSALNSKFKYSRELEQSELFWKVLNLRPWIQEEESYLNVLTDLMENVYLPLSETLWFPNGQRIELFGNFQEIRDLQKDIVTELNQLHSENHTSIAYLMKVLNTKIELIEDSYLLYCARLEDATTYLNTVHYNPYLLVMVKNLNLSMETAVREISLKLATPLRHLKYWTDTYEIILKNMMGYSITEMMNYSGLDPSSAEEQNEQNELLRKKMMESNQKYWNGITDVAKTRESLQKLLNLQHEIESMAKKLRLSKIFKTFVSQLKKGWQKKIDRPSLEFYGDLLFYDECVLVNKKKRVVLLFEQLLVIAKMKKRRQRLGRKIVQYNEMTIQHTFELTVEIINRVDVQSDDFFNLIFFKTKTAKTPSSMKFKFQNVVNQSQLTDLIELQVAKNVWICRESIQIDSENGGSQIENKSGNLSNPIGIEDDVNGNSDGRKHKNCETEFMPKTSFWKKIVNVFVPSKKSKELPVQNSKEEVKGTMSSNRADMDTKIESQVNSDEVVDHATPACLNATIECVELNGKISYEASIYSGSSDFDGRNGSTIGRKSFDILKEVEVNEELVAIQPPSVISSLFTHIPSHQRGYRVYFRKLKDGSDIESVKSEESTRYEGTKVACSKEDEYEPSEHVEVKDEFQETEVSMNAKANSLNGTQQEDELRDVYKNDEKIHLDSHQSEEIKLKNEMKKKPKMKTPQELLASALCEIDDLIGTRVFMPTPKKNPDARVVQFLGPRPVPEFIKQGNSSVDECIGPFSSAIHHHNKEEATISELNSKHANFPRTPTLLSVNVSSATPSISSSKCQVSTVDTAPIMTKGIELSTTPFTRDMKRYLLPRFSHQEYVQFPTQMALPNPPRYFMKNEKDIFSENGNLSISSSLESPPQFSPINVFTDPLTRQMELTNTLPTSSHKPITTEPSFSLADSEPPSTVLDPTACASNEIMNVFSFQEMWQEIEILKREVLQLKSLIWNRQFKSST